MAKKGDTGMVGSIRDGWLRREVDGGRMTKLAILLNFYDTSLDILS